MEINNFYTAPSTRRARKFVRMIRTLIGAQNFRKGMDCTSRRHDGQAVTCDDFVRADGRCAAPISRSSCDGTTGGGGDAGTRNCGRYDAPAKR